MNDTLKVLEDALVGASDDGLTVRELVQQTGRNRDWVLDRLQALAARGLLVVGRRQVKDIAGRPQMIPVYKVVPGGS